MFFLCSSELETRQQGALGVKRLGQHDNYPAAPFWLDGRRLSLIRPHYALLWPTPRNKPFWIQRNVPSYDAKP